MSWEPEPEEANGFAGDFRASRPRVESPMSWSLPVMRLGSVSVRVHGAFLLFIAVEALRSSLPSTRQGLGFGLTLEVLAFFALLSIVHEAARWWAMRRAGWYLDEWLLWPLGGLAGPAASASGLPAPRVECSGVLALAALGIVNGSILQWLRGDLWGTTIPAPWTLDGFGPLTVAHPGALVETLFLLQWTVLVVLSLNLLPAFPLASGRALASRWVSALGWSAGLVRASRVGTACAVAVFVAGLAFGSWTLTLLSLLLWISARETLLRVAAGDGFLSAPDRPEPPRARDASDQAEIDRILEKINRLGMGSLSFLERRRLRAATRRRQEGDGPVR